MVFTSASNLCRTGTLVFLVLVSLENRLVQRMHTEIQETSQRWLFYNMARTPTVLWSTRMGGVDEEKSNLVKFTSHLQFHHAHDHLDSGLELERGDVHSMVFIFHS